MVVPHSCDNKAISAPRWVLAGWLGLSLATDEYSPDLTFLSETQALSCDLEQLLTLIGLDYCAEMNSEYKHDADLPLFNNRSYGGTMTIWRKSLDKFVSIHPTTS